MANIIYLEDHCPGVTVYYPELGDRKPEVKMEASLGHYGTHYYVDTPLDLKGRGIVKLDASWVPGCLGAWVPERCGGLEVLPGHGKSL